MIIICYEDKIIPNSCEDKMLENSDGTNDVPVMNDVRIDEARTHWENLSRDYYIFRSLLDLNPINSSIIRGSVADEL